MIGITDIVIVIVSDPIEVEDRNLMLDVGP